MLGVHGQIVQKPVTELKQELIYVKMIKKKLNSVTKILYGVNARVVQKHVTGLEQEQMNAKMIKNKPNRVVVPVQQLLQQ